MKRLVHLDFLRIFSVSLVMYAHFVTVAGLATDIPNVIASGASLPLIDNTRWILERFELFLITNFSTQAGVLGVSLFFLITGYLMPMMLERYGRKEFLINRFFRIVPTLVAATIFTGLFLKITQGINLPINSYLASMTLSYEYLGIVPVMGVLWTLVIEMLFYIVAFLIGRFTLERLIFTQSILILLVFSGVFFKEIPLIWLMGYHSRYILMITIGSAFFLAEKKMGKKGHFDVFVLLPSLIFSFTAFQLFRFGSVVPSSYGNLGNHILAVTIFVAFSSSYRLWQKLPFLSVIKTASNLVYPLYLLHVAVGLVTIQKLQNLFNNPYISLLGALGVSTVLAWFLHVLVEVPGIKAGRKLASRPKNPIETNAILKEET